MKMKNWRKTDKDKSDLIDELEAKLKRKIERIQDKTWSLLIELSNDLDTTKGILRNSAKNISKASQRVSSIFISLSKEARKNLVRWIVRNVNKVLGYNVRYTRIFAPINSSYVKRLRNSLFRALGYDWKNKRLVKDGFLYLTTEFTELKKQVVSFYNSSFTNAKQTLKDFTKKFKEFFTGGKDKLGLIQRFFGQQTEEVFITTSRAAQEKLAQKAKLNFALYIGNKIPTTRGFCFQRYNKVYTRKEVESWSDLDWQGKKKNNNILTDLGGWNCRHHLAWISDELAAQLAKQRGGLNTYRKVA